MRALLAFDKFKDAISASDACAVAASALRELHPTWEIDLCPLTDGGEGFAEILTAGARGTLHTAEVAGPREKRVNARFGLVRFADIPSAARQRLELPAAVGGEILVAIIEMAAASGLALLTPDERDPWQTSTAGTGELIQRAVALGAQAIVLGIGGSATNDLGLGALGVLGLNFFSATGEIISRPVPAKWSSLARITGEIPPQYLPIRVACDVTNPVLGPDGCSAVYGPQKGLRPADFSRMEESASRMAHLLCEHCRRSKDMLNVPGAGAAGGIAFGLMTAAGARILSGFTLTADWLDLPARIRSADVVLTGEGHFDASSSQGKGPGAILALAASAGRPAHVFAGKISAAAETSARLHQITPADWSREKALSSTRASLRAAIQLQFAATDKS